MKCFVVIILILRFQGGDQTYLWTLRPFHRSFLPVVPVFPLHSQPVKIVGESSISADCPSNIPVSRFHHSITSCNYSPSGTHWLVTQWSAPEIVPHPELLKLVFCCQINFWPSGLSFNDSLCSSSSFLSGPPGHWPFYHQLSSYKAWIPWHIFSNILTSFDKIQDCMKVAFCFYPTCNWMYMCFQTSKTCITINSWLLIS